MGASPPLLLAIDLGTSAATMAAFEADGRSRVVPNVEGTDHTPTAVHFYDADGLVIGDEALKMAALDPENTVRYLPTWLGDAERTFDLKGGTFSAQELLALLLMKLRDDATTLRGQEVEEVVFALPSWFDAAQRQAVQDAALICGLYVRELYPRATAAVAGVGIDRFEDGATVLVVNFGGTALEVALVRREGNVLRTLSSRADPQLGARDFEQRLSEHLAVTYEERHGFTAHDDEQMLQQLLETGRYALTALANQNHVTLQIGHGSQRMRMKVSREAFAEWTYDLVHRAHRTVDDALAAAELTRDAVDHVLIVGTAARLHGIRDALSRWVGHAPVDVLDPHTAVARGAAFMGVNEFQPDHPGLTASPPDPTAAPPPLTRPDPVPTSASSRFTAALGLADGGHIGDGSETPPPPTTPTRVEMAHIAPRSIGIVALDRNRRERVVELIPEGAELPYRFRGRFVYAYPNMTAVRVEITEGFGIHRDHVDIIGVVELKNLPPRPRGTPIEVVYLLGRDQILQVRVEDVVTGQRQDARIKYRGALSDDEIHRARERTRTLTE
jgi:molecular chaperone DnaK